MQIQALKRRLSYVNEALQGRAFLTGASFTVADAYLFTILGWMDHLGIALGDYPAVKGFFERVQARPAVQAALKAESGGL